MRKTLRGETRPVPLANVIRLRRRDAQGLARELAQQIGARRRERPIDALARADRPAEASTVHTTLVMGCHFQNRSRSSRLEIKTKVLRSTDFGTIFVHQPLKAGRAITLC